MQDEPETIIIKLSYMNSSKQIRIHKVLQLYKNTFFTIFLVSLTRVLMGIYVLIAYSLKGKETHTRMLKICIYVLVLIQYSVGAQLHKIVLLDEGRWLVESKDEQHIKLLKSCSFFDQRKEKRDFKLIVYIPLFLWCFHYNLNNNVCGIITSFLSQIVDVNQINLIIIDSSVIIVFCCEYCYESGCFSVR